MIRPPAPTPLPALRPSIEDALIEQGYACVFSFLSPLQVNTLAAETLRLWDDGEFQFARIGAGVIKQRCPEVRSDRIFWLENESLTPAQQVYFNALDEFGTVSVGRRADLILLEANPLEDIANLQRRAGVMVRGRWLAEAEIQERLAGIARQFRS